MKRRQMLIGLGMTSLTAPWLTARSATDTSATDGKPGKTKIVDLLYVQSARETTLKNGVLRLSTVNPSTLFFSDRPERIVGHEPIEDFVEEWGLGEDSFASNPPNAVLSILVGPKPQEITVVLNNPRLENADLVYDVKVLDGEKVQ